MKVFFNCELVAKADHFCLCAAAKGAELQEHWLARGEASLETSDLGLNFIERLGHDNLNIFQRFVTVVAGVERVDVQFRWQCFVEAVAELAFAEQASIGQLREPAFRATRNGDRLTVVNYDRGSRQAAARSPRSAAPIATTNRAANGLRLGGGQSLGFENLKSLALDLFDEASQAVRLRGGLAN